jgi:hypothetical protein
MPFTTARAAVLLALSALSTAAPALAQTVVAGPVYNPATGSRYYLLDSPSVAAAATWAEATVKGRLAEVSDFAENEFIRAAFANTNPERKIEIGLSDTVTEGNYLWNNAPGGPTYRNWAPGEPAQSNNASADHVQMFSDGLWYPRQDSFTNFVVVETTAPAQVPGEFASVNDAAAFLETVGGGVIELAPGDYRVAPTIDQTVPLTVRGAGAGLTTLRHGVVTSIMFRFGDTLTLEDLRLVPRPGTGLPLVSPQGGSLRIRRCVIEGDGTNVGISPGSDARIENTVFRRLGRAISIGSPQNRLTAVNCVFVDVDAVVGGVNNTVFDFVNCTFVNIAGSEGTWTAVDPRLVNCVARGINVNFYRAGVTINSSLLPFGVPGAGNIVGQAQFVNTGAGDYRLLPTSPGVDAADAAAFEAAGALVRDAAGAVRVLDLAGVPNSGADALGLDMGAFETPASLLPPLCVPDLNKDGELTFDDIQAFIAAFNAGC